MLTWNKTKIVATLGPASNSELTISKMLAAGADMIRLNGAHGTPEEHAENIARVKKTAGKAALPAAILLDLPGPKVRIGDLSGEKGYLKGGEEVVLSCGKKRQKKHEIPIPYKYLYKGVKAGSTIYINDGAIELRVMKVRGSDIHCAVQAGGEIRSHKGLNLPNAELDIPSLTPKDMELIRVATGAGVDYLGLSFVRNAGNVRALKSILARRASGIRVVAKIETATALGDIVNIIDAADAVMVARGDLGIEIRLEKVPAIQREILYKCHLAGKPSITATQMLESMVNARTPTRAEVTDVANAVWEGSDAVMLSAETSIGRYPVLAVKKMAGIALAAEAAMPVIVSPEEDAAPMQGAEAICSAAALLAEKLGAKAIVTPTRSGRTALFVSKRRPAALILAPTEDEAVARQMMLYWGVRPQKMPRFATVDELLRSAEKLSLKTGLIKRGDVIVITSGAHDRKGDVTRIVEVRSV